MLGSDAGRSNNLVSLDAVYKIFTIANLPLNLEVWWTDKAPKDWNLPANYATEIGPIEDLINLCAWFQTVGQYAIAAMLNMLQHGKNEIMKSTSATVMHACQTNSRINHLLPKHT